MKKLKKTVQIIAIAFISVSGLISCTKDESEELKTPGQTITFGCETNSINSSTIWADVVSGEGIDYIVSCPVTIRGTAILTIAPGVIIQFVGATSGLFVTENAGLTAVGAVDKPIKFLGKGSAKGSWKGVFFGSNNPGNQLAYVTVSNAGSEIEYYSDSKAAIAITEESLNARASITNCTISESEGYGLWVAKGRNISGFSNNVFKNNAEAPVALTFENFGKLDAASKYKEGNGKPFIDMYGDGTFNGVTIKEAITVIPLEVPYRISGIVYIEKSVTIQPGTVMEFNPGAEITTSDQYYNNMGGLNASGTTEKRIVFKGVQPGQASWVGIEFASNNPNNKLIFCDIIGAGSESTYNAPKNALGNVVIGDYYNKPATVIIQNCNILDGGGAGIAIKSSATYSASGNIFTNNKLGDVFLFN